MTSAMTLTQIHVYPIKSCAGSSLRQAEIDAFGITGDRRLMIVDASGQFLSQRSHPSLARVRPNPGARTMVVTAPGMNPLELPARPRGMNRSVTIWGDECGAVSAGRHPSEWFTRYLGIPCDLVWMPEESRRPVDPAYGRAEDRVSFADGFPFLLISQASLDHLNDRLDTPLGMDRFRPNLVVDGCPPHAEDGWRRLTIGNCVFRVVKPCARCVVTTVDQESGAIGPEPLATLATYRRDGRKVLFGQNLVHDGPGRIRVGDAVHVQP